ncbi:MAG: sigma-70 family RNA polymerase sigma factor [Planctomycetes bacterium]|nr:sigma-70 family RNA polymerase sigma factor [Planctomycetota bacterium]
MPDSDRLLTILLNEQAPPEQKVADLLPAVYDELRAAAGRALRGERKEHTLQATALVHEAWLKLMGPRDVPWRNRGHFLAAAAEAMRRILIDHARAKAAQRRGGGLAKRAALELQTLPDPASVEQNAGFLLLDEVLTKLADVDAQAAAVVRLRYFTGLTIDEAAQALGVSAPTVQRDWAFARSWLRDAIGSLAD